MRLHPDNAKQLFALVKEQGVLNATVVISGDEPRRSAPAVASQRSPQQRSARNAPQYDDEIVSVDPRSVRGPAYRQPTYRQPEYPQGYYPAPPPGYYYAPQPAPGYYGYYR